jgi:hypothetical protein
MGRTINDFLTDVGIEVSEDELAHYGVKGMRWGKRKKHSPSDSTPEPPRPDIKKMTDEELRSAINRIKMEKEFSKLTAPEVNRGRKIVGEMLLDVGKQQAKAYLNRQVEAALKEGLKGAAKKTAKVGAQLALEAAVSKAASGGRSTMQFTPRANAVVKL